MGRTMAAIAALAVFLACGGPAQAGQGEDLFKARCAPCHGNNGKGSSAAPPLKDNELVGRSSESELSSLISKGLSGTEKRYSEYSLPMPGFEFSEDEMKALTAHLKSLARRQPPAAP